VISPICHALTICTSDLREWWRLTGRRIRREQTTHSSKPFVSTCWSPESLSPILFGSRVLAGAMVFLGCPGYISFCQFFFSAAGVTVHLGTEERGVEWSDLVLRLEDGPSVRDKQSGEELEKMVIEADASCFHFHWRSMGGDSHTSRHTPHAIAMRTVNVTRHSCPHSCEQRWLSYIPDDRRGRLSGVRVSNTISPVYIMAVEPNIDNSGFAGATCQGRKYNIRSSSLARNGCMTYVLIPRFSGRGEPLILLSFRTLYEGKNKSV